LFLLKDLPKETGRNHEILIAVIRQCGRNSWRSCVSYLRKYQRKFTKK